MDQLTTVLKVLESLNAHRVEYVVIGGVAMNIHGIIRATEDLDIFVRAEAVNIEQLRAALFDVWQDPEIEGITAEDLCGDYPAVRYGPPEDGLYLDILTRLGTFAGYDDLQSEWVEIGNVSICVATPECLYRLKRATVRPVDRQDAVALARAFGLEDE